MKKFFEDFKAFAMRGNVIDMAVGIIIGGAFGKATGCRELRCRLARCVVRGSIVLLGAGSRCVRGLSVCAQRT